MGVISEQSTFPNDIYQLELTDVVIGGDPDNGGTANKQAKQLADRTRFLRNMLQAYEGFELAIVSSNMSFNYSALKNKLLFVTTAFPGRTLSINVDSMPVGSCQSVMIYGGTDGTNVNPVKIHIAGAVIMKLLGVCKSAPSDYVWLHPGEKIEFVKLSNTECQILDTNAELKSVGDIVTKVCDLGIGYIPAQGQLVMRNVYPRLFEAISNVAVSDATWASDIKHTGKFSLGNGSTNFRMPDLRGVFLRGQDNGRALDTSRTGSNNIEGLYVADSLRQHNHKIGVGSFYITAQDPATIDNTTGVRSLVIQANSNNQRVTWTSEFSQDNIGNETAPKSVGYTVYIKY